MQSATRPHPASGRGTASLERPILRAHSLMSSLRNWTDRLGAELQRSRELLRELRAAGAVALDLGFRIRTVLAARALDPPKAVRSPCSDSIGVSVVNDPTGAVCPAASQRRGHRPWSGRPKAQRMHCRMGRCPLSSAAGSSTEHLVYQ